MSSGFLNRIAKFSDKEKMAFRKKAIIFTFFLLLSVIFWFMNALSKNYTTNIEYPVIYRKFPSDKVLVGELPEHLTLKVNAHGYTLLRYRVVSRHIPIVFNVRSFSMNLVNEADSSLFFIETRFAREYFAKQLSSEFEILEIRPDTLYFKFANVISKRVPVESQLQYELNKQLVLKDELEITPDSVNISGPDYIVDTTDVVHTKNTDIGLISQSIEKTVDLEKIKHVDFEQLKVRVKFDVEKYTERTLQVPITVVNQPDTAKLKTFPGYVEVTCQVGLSNYEKLQSSMFTAEVDYEEARAGKTNKILVEVTREPDFIKSLKFSPRTVEYLIEK